MARGSQEGLSATSLGVRPRGSFDLLEPTKSPRLRFKLFPDMLALYTMNTCIIRYPNRCSRVNWQTRLAVRLVWAVAVDRGGLFVRGRLRWIPKGLRITPAVVSRGEHMYIFWKSKNKVGLAGRKQNQLGGTDPTGQVGKKWLSRRLPVVFCCKVGGIELLTE
ncbi:hypothetical protein CRG98_046203 [Punica granatum]|uniref:Uncharacterized protein n=1 Tax=Punica granatum TaxID=22663 RepID=A0A2I0HQ46_PUNGR|nr:hypothetical protein CRG98_046203 [Punica granatum]